MLLNFNFKTKCILMAPSKLYLAQISNSQKYVKNPAK